MTRKNFIKLLADGGAVITAGTYAGLSRKAIFHGYGNEPYGKDYSGGIVPEMNGKSIPDGDVKKVAICDTDIPFVRGGVSLRGKNGEVLSSVPKGSMVHFVMGIKPFRIYLIHTPDETMKDAEYCVFRFVYGDFPLRSLELWDGEKGFKMYVPPKALRERAAWWETRNNLIRRDLDIQLAKFIEKGTIEEKDERTV